MRLPNFVVIVCILAYFNAWAESPSPNSADKTILLAILAKDKAHTLPTFLQCIDHQDYDKKMITVYIRTNNNKDATKEILREWVDKIGSNYKKVIFDDTDLEKVPVTNPHDWTPERWQILANIRNESLQKTLENGCDFYFVADCDIFLAPSTLKTLVKHDKPIIAPMLRTVNNLEDPYSNYFGDIDANGYYKNHPIYMPILQRQIIGTFLVPLVHVAYMIKSEYIKDLSYIDGTREWEFIIFSRNARKKGISQYICNEEDFGTMIHLPHTATQDEEVALFQKILKENPRLDSYKSLKESAQLKPSA